MSTIPFLYRLAFGIFDLLMPAYGIYAHVMDQEAVLAQSYALKPLSPAAPETVLLLDATAGWFAALAFLHVYLAAYRRHDLSLWKALQGAVLLVDIFMLFGLGRSLLAARRLNPADWATNDRANVGGYMVIALVRLAFLSGIGLARSSTSSSQALKKEL